MNHTYIEYHRKDIDGFLVKCDTVGCPSPAEIVLGMKMLCQPCAAQQSVQRTAGTWRKFLNFVGRVAGSLRRR